MSPTFPANITEDDVMLSYLPLAHIFDRCLASMVCMLLHLETVLLGVVPHACIAFSPSAAPQQPCSHAMFVHRSILHLTSLCSSEILSLQCQILTSEVA